MNARPPTGQLGVLDLMAIGVAVVIVVLEAGLWLWAVYPLLMRSAI